MTRGKYAGHVVKRGTKKIARRATRRMRKYISAGVLILVGAALICLTGYSGSDKGGIAEKSSSASYSAIQHETVQVETASDSSTIAFEMDSNMEEAKFSRKVDGDTAYFTLSSGEEIKVRFLAVDTPETVKSGTEVQEWGPEASSYTEERLENASEIYLEWDDASDRKDAYGRYLAWVWVDGSLIEEELVSQGLAEVKYIYGDYKYANQLYEVQEAAKIDRIGIWS